MKWTANDWICACIGWVSASAVATFVPESFMPLKLILIFWAGFSAAWIARAF